MRPPRMVCTSFLTACVCAMQSLPLPWWKYTYSTPEVVQRVAQVEREFVVFQSCQGAFSRPSALENAKEMEPSQWWTIYGKHVPLLASLAQHVLSQPAAASAAERNWSVYWYRYRQIHTQHRSSMSHHPSCRGQACLLSRNYACADARAKRSMVSRCCKVGQRRRQ